MKKLLLPFARAVLLSIGLFGTCQLAQAQAPAITAFSPARNAIAAGLSSPVVLTCSQPLNAATVGNAQVFSTLSGGRKAATATASGNVLTVQPTRGFRPGEVISVTVPATVTSAAAVAIAPAVYQFTAAAGVGPATFSTGADVTVGGYGAALLVDVDNDGDLDLVAPGATRSVSLNDGRGSFSPTATPSIGAGGALSTADLDNDGDLDVLVRSVSPPSSGSVVTLRNNGSGVFTFGQQLLAPIVGAPTGLATGDVDGDGDLDVLVSGNFLGFPGPGAPPPTSATLYRNRGNGSYSNPVALVTGGANGVLLADVDGDSDLDMVLGSGTAQVYRNDGTGQFSSGPTVVVNGGGLRAADIDNDGDLDLLSFDNNTGLVYVNRNNGSGTFGPATNVLVGFGPVQLAVADLDGDGDLDFITGNNNAGVYSASIRLNNGSGTFGGGSDPALPGPPSTLVTGDVDGDGDLDFATDVTSLGTVRVQLNGGTGPALATAPSAPSATLAPYPNPARGTATLRLPAAAQNHPLALLDALGREMRRYPAPAGAEATLDLHGLPAGVYVLRSGAGSQRLVIE